jgi:hypothetical protein
LSSNLFLAAHGVDRDQCVLQLDLLQQLSFRGSPREFPPGFPSRVFPTRELNDERRSPAVGFSRESLFGQGCPATAREREKNLRQTTLT